MTRFSLLFLTLTFLIHSGASAETILQANSSDNLHLLKTLNTKTGKLNFLSVENGYSVQLPATVTAAGLSKEQIARSFLAVYGVQFGVKDQGTELVTSKIKNASDSRTIVRFSQTYKGIPVYGSDLIVNIAGNNSLISISGGVASEINITTTAAVSEKEATNIALQTVANSYKVSLLNLKPEKSELIVFNTAIMDMPGDNSNILAWKSRIKSVSEENVIDELVFIDAANGNVIYHFNQIPHAKNRKTYDFQHTTTTLVLKRSEGQADIGDQDVDRAHNYAGRTYDFYKLEHNRDSINNAGMALISRVRYSTNYCNAFWNGSTMTYGDGCSIVADDVVAHELTHGVTQYESGLVYSNQSGAINEAFSDIWGEFVDLRDGVGTDTSTVRWLMGEDTSLGAIRNMKNPSAKGQPDRTRSTRYYCGTGDNGGVHINSGVANKTAFLLTDGGTFNGYTISGLGISKTADLFYEVQTNILTQNATYPVLFAALKQACTNLLYTATECQQVDKAGRATQMNLTPCPVTIPVAPSNVTASYSNGVAKISWTDKSNNETVFYIYRWDGSQWIYVAATDPYYSSYSYSSTSSTLYYAVGASNSAGTSWGYSF